MTYTLRGKVAVLIDWLRAHPDVTEITGTQASEIMELSKSNVANTVKAAIVREVLFSRRSGQRCFYALQPYPPEPEPDREPFNPCLWGDGDLVLRGVIQLEDGSVQVNAADVPVLKRLLNGTVIT